MNEKISNSGSLDTKLTSIARYRSGETFDATKILRKEEIIRKKLKSILDVNQVLEK